VKNKQPGRGNDKHGQTDIIAPELFLSIPHLAYECANSVPLFTFIEYAGFVSEPSILRTIAPDKHLNLT
jgi:hypothetical protein